MRLVETFLSPLHRAGERPAAGRLERPAIGRRSDRRRPALLLVLLSGCLGSCMTVMLDYREVDQPMMLNPYPTAAAGDASPGQSPRPSYQIEGTQSEPWREVGSHRVSVYHEEDLLTLGYVALPTTRESVHAAEIAVEQLKGSEARAIVNLHVEASTFGFYYLVGTRDSIKLEVSGSVVERLDQEERNGTDEEERSP